MILPIVLALAVRPLAGFESAPVTLGRFRLRYQLDTGMRATRETQPAPVVESGVAE